MVTNLVVENMCLAPFQDGDQFSRGEHVFGSIPVVSLVLGVFTGL